MSTDIFRGNAQIKGHGIKYPYTHEEIQEYAKCSKDPIYFIKNYVKIISLDKGLVNFELYPYQEEMIMAMHTKNRLCLLTGRQQGKCFCINSKINIKNKKTGEIKSITIGEFYEMQKAKSHQNGNQ